MATERSDPAIAETRRSSGFIARFWPLALLLAVALAAYGMGLHRQLSMGWLIEQQAALRHAVSEHPVLAPVAFVLAYGACVACAVPGGLVMSTAAGLMFGTWLGGAYAIVAITLGSTVLFLAARSALRPVVERLARRMLRRGLPALDGDGFLYLLAVRLVPFTPFWMVNIAAAMTKIGPRAYAAATFIGIAPITFILAAAGSGIGDSLVAGEQPGLATILRPEILVPLFLLALVSLAPIALKQWRRRRSLASAATRSPAT